MKITLTRYLNWSSLTFIATLAGIAVPIWLWSFDLNSRSVSMNVLSQSEITSQVAGTVEGLQILVDGVAISAPVLSVVQISNDGKKPIPASDFESPLEMRLNNGGTIIRAKVTSTAPRDIEAKIAIESQVLRLQPLLLNPGDTVTLSILTSGKLPSFQPRARIAGISSIQLTESTPKVPSQRLALMALVVSIVFFAASDIVNSSFVGGKPFVIVRKRAALLIMVICGTAGMGAFFAFYSAVGLEGWAWLGGLMFLVVIAGAIFAGILNRGADQVARTSAAA